MTVYKPNSDDKARIRAAARKASGCLSVKLRPSILCHADLNQATVESLNALLVAPTREEAQSIDQTEWATFVGKGVELTDDGNAVLDIAVYSTGAEASLENHLTLTIEGGRLSQITYCA